MTDSITLKLSCPKCGTTPQTDLDDDESEVVCGNPECDARFGTWGDLKKQSRAKAAEFGLSEIRKILKRRRR